MRWWRSVGYWRPWWGKRSQEELDRELQAHLDLEAQEQQEAGLAPDKARYAARRAFGNVTLAKENTRAVWEWTSLDRFVQDLRYALRMLRKSPGFTSAAVLTLALGIGANASIFTFVNALLLRSLNIVAPQELVWVAATYGDGTTSSTTHSYRFYEILRDMEAPLQGVFAYGPRPTAIAFGERTERITAGLATGEFFPLLGARPHLGRLFGPADDSTPGAHPVAVLEHSFWRDRFGSDPEAVGRQIMLAGHPFTIIGVAEEGFTGPDRRDVPDLWTPMTMTAEVLPSFGAWQQAGWLWLNVLARLQPGVPLEQARAAADIAFQRYTEERIAGLSPARRANERARRVVLEPAAHGGTRAYERYRRILTLLGAIVGLLLLIACANVASLLLARASSRRQEVALRLAIGAGRGRLVRQLLTEGLLLASIGAAIGLLFAWYLNPPLAAYLRLEKADLLPDPTVIAFTLALSGVTTLLFGLAPAWKASQLSLSSWLKGTGQVGTEHRHWGLRGAFVTTQIALCLPTLIAAGLLLRSLANLYAVNLGFQARQLVRGMIDPLSNGYDEKRIAAIYDNLLERLQLRPGVLSAALGSSGAFSGHYSGRNVYREDATDPDTGGEDTSYIQVSEDYLAALGIRLLAGRFFERTDTAESPRVAVVNETLARRLFGPESALGQRLKFSVNAESRLMIVGVVSDSKNRGIREEIRPTLYLSHRQQTPAVASIYIRTEGNSSAAADILREELRAVDPHLPVFGLRTMEEQINTTLRDDRILAGFLIGFGLVGLLLAAVGLYGVLAYGVTRRFRELGLRKALGARDTHLVRLVLASGARWVGVGLLIGCGLALVVTRLLEQSLFGLEPTDLKTYVSCTAFLALVAILAAYLPARRAARIDPMEALRYE